MKQKFNNRKSYPILTTGLLLGITFLVNILPGTQNGAIQKAAFNLFGNPPMDINKTAAPQMQEPDLPEGYKLLYSEDFENKRNLRDFTMTDDKAWKITNKDGNNALELHQQSEYQPRVRTPRNIAFFNKEQFGSFVLKVDLLQTGREYGHRDMCIFYGIKDPSNFYYTHFASATDPHAHNIFLVNDEDRVKISSKTSEGIDWGEEEWHTVKIERNIEDGTIKVYFDDMDNPIMEATDKHFDFGYIGLGSFDDTGMVDNIKIWGPGEVTDKDHFFDVRGGE